MADTMEDFEKEVFGENPGGTNVEKKEEMQESWKGMSLKELRRYYKTQIEDRRNKEATYLLQRSKCKTIREKMKAMEAK